MTHSNRLNGYKSGYASSGNVHFPSVWRGFNYPESDFEEYYPSDSDHVLRTLEEQQVCGCEHPGFVYKEVAGTKMCVPEFGICEMPYPYSTP
jgi:hypothetical protein